MMLDGKEKVEKWYDEIVDTIKLGFEKDLKPKIEPFFKGLVVLIAMVATVCVGFVAAISGIMVVIVFGDMLFNGHWSQFDVWLKALGIFIMSAGAWSIGFCWYKGTKRSK